MAMVWKGAISGINFKLFSNAHQQRTCACDCGHVAFQGGLFVFPSPHSLPLATMSRLSFPTNPRRPEIVGRGERNPQVTEGLVNHRSSLFFSYLPLSTLSGGGKTA
jgi:hypothetical protein